MLSVIATGGKQYLVKTGDVVKIEKVEGEVGDQVVFDKVLLSADDQGEFPEVGAPYVKDGRVNATIVKQGKERTVRVEKFKNKTRYHKVHGQRQRYTEVKIG
jgi:large subunit ribosomal protein L21